MFGLLLPAVVACHSAGKTETLGACGAGLGPAPTQPRPSSLRPGDCDWGEAQDFTIYDVLCPQGSCMTPPQTGDALCHRICDDGRCAPGEVCMSRIVYVSDTPSRSMNLCVCPGGPCTPPDPTAASAPEPEGGLAPWRAETSLPVGVYYHAAAADEGRLWVSGGLRVAESLPNGSATLAPVDDVSVAVLGASGALGPWAAAGKLPAALVNHGMAVAGGRIYVAGGAADNIPGAMVWSAPLAADGTVGDWRAEAPLPAERTRHLLLADGDLLVVTGGVVDARYSNGTDRIWTAALGADGAVGAWTEALAPVPVFYDGGAGVAAGRLHVLGEDGLLHSAPLPALTPWRTERSWHIYKSPLAGSAPTDPNMGPVHLHPLCGALLAIIGRGNVLTAPLDEQGQVGDWRNASRFVGPQTGYATAGNDTTVFSTGGFETTAAGGNRSVWSTHRD